MPALSLQGIDSEEDLVEQLAEITKLLNWLLNGNISFDNIKANSITADRMNVSELSAISANLGHITAGLIEAVQIFGSYIATSQSYPKVEFTSNDNFIKAAQDANHYAVITPTSSGKPAFVLYDGVAAKSLVLFIDPVDGAYITNIGALNIGDSGNILNLFGSIVFINGVNFNSKADKSSVSKTVYVSSTLGGAADTPMTITNGVVTS